MAGGGDPEAIWRYAFGLTFAAELRAERLNRSSSIVDADTVTALIHSLNVAVAEVFAATLIAPG